MLVSHCLPLPYAESCVIRLQENEKMKTNIRCRDIIEQMKKRNYTIQHAISAQKLVA
jgi:azurin